MNYKSCPLKKRPVFYDQVRNVNSVDDEPQDLSVKRKADVECFNIAKRNFPLNLSTTSIYDQMKQASYMWHSTESIPRTESPVSDYSESSVKRETSLSPPAEPLPTGVHLRGLTPVQVNQAYLSHHGFAPYLPAVLPSNLTPPASPTQEESEPEDLSIKSGVPLTVLYHHHHQPTMMSQREKIDDRSRFRCDKCGKSYSTLTGLSKHTQFHCPAAECNQVKKTFSCKSCDKVYTSLGALKMHIRTHTLPCRCNICGKAFSRPWLLQGHIRTHTGEKPFECEHCHRAFADRSNLRAHQQTHVEVKKYICECCNKSFSRMSLLNKHVQGGCPGQNC